MKPIRVTMVWSEREASAPDKIFLDLYVDGFELPHRELTFLGWLTYGQEIFPFKLTKDGRIDFGSAFDDDSRWGSTNVRNRKIERGEYANFDVDGESFTYRIDRLDDLSNL